MTGAFTVGDLGPAPFGKVGHRRYEILDTGRCVDRVPFRLSAELAVRELNASRAYVDSHLPLGCRVQPVVQLDFDRAAAS